MFVIQFLGLGLIGRRISGLGSHATATNKALVVCLFQGLAV